MQLLSRNIFIDTQYFLSRSFDFQGKEFVALEALVKKGWVNVYVTDITSAEILKKIKDEIPLAYSKVTSSDTRYLKVVPLFSKFLTTYSEEKIIQYIFDSYDRFIKRCKVKIISSDSVKFRNIFNDYSYSRPPFNSDKQKNRKNEFPDAFALATISNWTYENKKKTYVLSGDTDWESYAKTTHVTPWGDDDGLWLNTINSLSEFLDLVIRNESNLEDLTSFADSLIDANSKLIEKKAIDILKKSNYEDDSIDIDTKVTNSYIISTAVVQKEIISVNRTSAIYNLECEVELVLEYRKDSFENAVYDSEDGIYRNIQTFTPFQKFTTYEPLVVEIKYEDGLAANFQIISLEAPDPIYLYFEDGNELIPKDWVLNLPVLICGVSEGKITENGHGSESYENIGKALEVYPELDIYKANSIFTSAIGNRINEELRFETRKASEFYSDNWS